MKCSIRRVLAVVVVLCGYPACDNGRLDPTTGHVSGEVPPEHRVAATACSPSQNQPPVPDGGVPSCSSDSDCTAGGATAFATCVRGTCSFDKCLTDSDCTDGVCGCSTDYYGGNTAYHPNVCVPANCHTDSDCGPGGFCSPSRGRCGSYLGFYCHGSADTCVDPAMDCAGGAFSCVYTPITGTFVCGGAVCNG